MKLSNSCSQMIQSPIPIDRQILLKALAVEPDHMRESNSDWPA
jgi:hypothetical protein